MVGRIYGRLRLTGRSALRHAFRQTPYVGVHIAGPMAPIGNFIFAYCYLGQGHDSLQFSDRNLEKKCWEKISPQGGPTPNFLEKWTYPPRVMCLHIFTQISLKLWLVDVYEDSKHVILAPLRLCPRAQGVRHQNFFCIFFSGLGS